MASMEKAPLGYALKILAKIESLLTKYYHQTFTQWLETERIVCRPSYHLPAYIHPMNFTDMFGGSLYQAEEDMNKLEQDLVMKLTALPNVRWWHRNMARNGFINHYPDIIIMTDSRKIILAETKDGHLTNDDSRKKIELGNAWRNVAGNKYRYYMVFRDDETILPGALSMSQFVEMVKQL